MTETSTRFWIAMFVALVFVCGLSIGIATSTWIPLRGDGVEGRGSFRPSGPPPGPSAFASQRILDRLDRETDFTDDQREQLEALFDERERRFREFNREMRMRFESEQAALREEIAAILTASQMEIFDAARRRRLGRPGPGGPRGRERLRQP